MFKSAGNIGMIKMSRNDMKWISQDRAMQLEDVHVNRRPFELGKMWCFPDRKKGFVGALRVMKIVVCAFQL